MAAQRIADGPNPAANAHLARLDAAGSAGHPYVEDLGDPACASLPRDFDDLVHLLCSLYGRHPGPIDLAAAQCCDPVGQRWFAQAAEAFEGERLYLMKLAAAVGPMPSTPGNAETEAAMLAQRNALETLARSERGGCALGTATALVGDWFAVRPLLDMVARRVNVSVPPMTLPSETATGEAIAAAAVSPAVERAIRFGAEQLLLQHRALFDLLEARCEAREGF